MGDKPLNAELACERVWQVYCLMNPSAERREGLRADLDSYLSKMERVDSSNLTVDGLKYLKKLEQLEDRKFSRRRPASF
jgi:CRISPR/Cas system CMR-associated protein Cmr5 small subunit